MYIFGDATRGNWNPDLCLSWNHCSERQLLLYSLFLCYHPTSNSFQSRFNKAFAATGPFKSQVDWTLYILTTKSLRVQQQQPVVNDWLPPLTITKPARRLFHITSSYCSSLGWKMPTQTRKERGCSRRRIYELIRLGAASIIMQTKVFCMFPRRTERNLCL